MITIIKIYRNKRNENKYLEVHESKCSHFTVCQFMYWETERCGKVKNWTGTRKNRRKLRRWRKPDLLRLLEDYVEVDNEIKEQLYNHRNN